ncbi:hypothetical protein CEUSTIGMA_g10155.t1 [Chlamydomonas eustigma]|uniref:Sulfotransferase n=1 Tax=Chlamydomonas eustigma TaxID=1157962 RepID=A0A250XII6_9CHLO|nr:hypothetical protein CEUSTIGMA_g10155.t1 [Chlamydomonas eustigma]|eukprot:GAX82729.1 hypothetical protein CEUSTIGMA_g10155.t1 [Chlamydomonas eustigma]
MEERPVYHFTTKHRWQVRMHFFTGVTIWPWVRFLSQFWRCIDWATYFHRIIFLSIMSVLNTMLAMVEWILYSRHYNNQALHPEPVFILGHPRSGTTHLHYLMSQDPDFIFTTMFQAVFPSAFICLRPFQDAISRMIMDDHRPMDNVKLGGEVPAEDEIGVASLTGGISPYTAWSLQREEKRCFRDFYSFLRAKSSEAPSSSLHSKKLSYYFQEWQQCFLLFLKKVTYWYSRASSDKAPKQLLLKSPVHTARIQILLKMFPKAKFVLIHRHPMDVFLSSAHFADTYFWYTSLQQPTDRHSTDYILDQYELLHKQYMADRALIDKDCLHEVSFDELEADPLSSIQAIYTKFG